MTSLPSSLTLAVVHTGVISDEHEDDGESRGKRTEERNPQVKQTSANAY